MHTHTQAYLYNYTFSFLFQLFFPIKIILKVNTTEKKAKLAIGCLFRVFELKKKLDETKQKKKYRIMQINEKYKE
jgi:hypothetical protein